MEFLLIRAFAKEILKGTIDEPNQTAHITWVRPRILTVGQVKEVKDRLDAWTTEVESTVSFLKEQTPELFA